MEAGPTVGVLRLDLPPQASDADPDDLRSCLIAASLPVRLLSERDLATGAALVESGVDVVVLPYGDRFPATARDGFVAFLRSGGSFVSVGGYAFDRLVERRDGAWEVVGVDDRKRWLSGRRGAAGDSLRLRDEQIAVFDPTCRFRRVASFGKDEDSPLGGRVWSEAASLDGFPATALLGSNNPVFPLPHARWYPLVTARDRYGRSRGGVFSLVLHHDGPYRGSAWAFSGVTGEDLFGADRPAMRETLVRTIRAMRERVFLTTAETRESPPRLLCGVANYASGERRVELRLSGGDGVSRRTLRLAPGRTTRIEWPLEPSVAGRSRYEELVLSLLRPGLFNDRLTVGREARPSPARSRTDGVSVDFDGGYLHWNGRPSFLLGTNQTGIVWFSPREGPAAWAKDLSRMRDHGLRVLRVLHFSPFAARGFEGVGGHSALDLARRPSGRLVDRTDDLVAACRRHGVALVLTLHDWLPVELSDEELAAQRTWARFWAARYRDEPHVLFDIQNEPMQPRAYEGARWQARWNEFLGARYGGDAALREAWGRFAPSERLGEIPLAPAETAWDDPRARDHGLFRASLLERWIEANLAGVRDSGSRAPVTLGYIQMARAADKWLPSARLDFHDTHYHGPVDGLAPVLKLTDHRWRGQSLSLGEFGAWDAHQARAAGRYAEESLSARLHFLAATHLTFGFGGCLAASWDLEDLEDCIFPWGLSSANDEVPRDWLFTYRNAALLFSFLEPRVELPALWLVLPDSHRLGADGRRVDAALERAARYLLACHADFGVIPESFLDALPPAARCLFWPVPWCPDDATFGAVERFVRRGGTLYLSGEVGYDENRRPTRTGRYARLGLEPVEPAAPFATGPLRPSRLVDARVERGRVFFAPRPPEAASDEARGVELYRRVVSASGVVRHALDPPDPRTIVASVPLAGGGRAAVLWRGEPAEEPRRYSMRVGGSDVSLELRGRRTGLVELDRDGRVVAIEGSGELRSGDTPIARASAHAILRSLDGGPLARAKCILVLPTGAGRLEFPVSSGLTTAVAGEFRRGEWVVLERWATRRVGEQLRIDIDEDRATTVIVVASDLVAADVLNLDRGVDRLIEAHRN